MSIFEALEQFKGAPKVVFNEKYVGDKGAKDIAKFLQSHGKVEFLEIKSNDITGIGFAQIFKALLKNPNIRQIIIEHNKLGEEDENIWINYFSQLINQSFKLQRLNISNNKITAKVFGQMKVPISNSKSLKLLQLKYNQISSSQLNSLISQLQRAKNEVLLYVQLAGNKVQRQIINQLENYLKPNRQKNSIPKDNLMMTGGGFASNSRNQAGFNTQASFSRNNAIDDLSKQNVLRHLQNLLDEARKGTTDMKHKLQSELAQLQRQQKLDATQIIDLDRKCNQLTISNRNLNYQIQRTSLQHKQVQQDQQYQARVKQERIMEANRQLHQMQTKYEQIQKKMVRQHQAKLKQTSRVWQGRLKNIEDKIRGLQNQSNAVQCQIQKIAQSREKLRVDYEYQENNLRSRIQQQQIQRYDFKIKALQSRISEVEINRQRFYKRGEDILYQLQNKIQDSQKQIQDSEQKISELQIQEKTFVDKNKQLVNRNQSIKQQIGLKQIAIQNLQQQINKLNQQIQLRKSHNREQIDKIIKDHQFQRTRKGDDKQSQIQKLSDIQNILRTYKLQNAKLEQQYKILEHKLQVTLSKAVQEVFTDSNLY